mgnify:FL=1
MQQPSTFSIVARDPATGDLGIAVQSKFLAVGAVVPWAQAGVGAIATQARANVRYGPEGLALLAQGLSAAEALERLLAADPDCPERQVGIVDAQGRAATFTGSRCLAWAGGTAGAGRVVADPRGQIVLGDGFCCQGNILAGPEVVPAMAEAYQTTQASFPLRLIAALEAGQAAGGDARGQQSAALLVVRAGGGYGGGSDRFIDLRVDDHPEPIAELRRLLHLHRVYFSLEERDLVPLDAALLRTIQHQLHALGYLPTPDADTATTRAALERFVSVENLEERWRDDDQIDTVILEFLEARAARR